MSEPRRVEFGTNQSAGIRIEYIQRRKILYIRGWFDHFVGIEGGEIALVEFCKQLGIRLPKEKP